MPVSQTQLDERGVDVAVVLAPEQQRVSERILLLPCPRAVIAAPDIPPLRGRRIEEQERLGFLGEAGVEAGDDREIRLLVLGRAQSLDLVLRRAPQLHNQPPTWTLTLPELMLWMTRFTLYAAESYP